MYETQIIEYHITKSMFKNDFLKKVSNSDFNIYCARIK